MVSSFAHKIRAVLYGQPGCDPRVAYGKLRLALHVRQRPLHCLVYPPLHNIHQFAGFSVFGDKAKLENDLCSRLRPSVTVNIAFSPAGD